jgi:hypothetical protein
MQNSPLATVKQRFKDKAGLVKAVKGLMTEDLWIDRLDADKGLDSVSNRKLIHLHDLLTAIKADFGSRAKLIDALAGEQKRGKDEDYKKSLERHSTPRLYEIYRASKKRSKKAG